MPYVIQMPAHKADGKEEFCYLTGGIGRATFMCKVYDSHKGAELNLKEFLYVTAYRAPEQLGPTFNERVKKIRIVKLTTVNRRRRKLGLDKLIVLEFEYEG